MTPRKRILSPSCRVCGCTDDNACDEGCWWVKVEPASAPLCSACAGAAQDLREALQRIARLYCMRPNPLRSTAQQLAQIKAVARAAVRRQQLRQKGKVMT